MTSVAIVAFGAVSALGEGRAAFGVGRAGERARVAIGLDDELLAAGLARPFAARALVSSAHDRATELLARALASCSAELDRARPGWREERVGMVVGTSAGGMRAAEEAFARIARGQDRGAFDPEAATYFGPMARATRAVLLPRGPARSGAGAGLRRPIDPCILVLGACASSTIAVGLGARALERGECDVVLAGGFDEVTVFVAAGFEALRATTASPPPRPFRRDRDGMSLGEGAAVVALARAGEGRAHAFVTGFGAASDATHLTAPDRTGAGLARAALAALAEAADPRVDLVSAHATATPFNDAAEWQALVRALGPERAAATVVHPLKAQAGHALGASGALELLACVDAIERGVLPAAAGSGALDPEAPARVLDRATASEVKAALKLSSAFGGANAALVVSSEPSSSSARSPRRRAFLHPAVHVDRPPSLEDLSAWLSIPLERLARTDRLVQMALAAVARLLSALGSGASVGAGRLAGAGVVVGSALATIETNALFAARLRDRGARSAEPRRFPYTSPNAVAGECSIAFGLTGPSFSVGGGLHAAVEAIAAAALLVEGGDADRMVVVAVDDVGPTARALGGEALVDGAVALLVSAAPSPGARARVGAISLPRGASSSDARAAPVAGHRALLPLVRERWPSELVASSPPDASARIALEPI